MKTQIFFFQLQDLAISPGIQDPSLNTAECVIKGHEPKLTDAGRKSYIIATMWLSFCFAFFLSPWLAIYTLIYFDNVKCHEKALYNALKWASVTMLIVELGLFIAASVLSGQSKAPAKCHILSILIIIMLEGLIAGGICSFKKIPELKNCKCAVLRVIIFILASMTSYHFCWVVIGVLMNVLWGVTVFLFIYVVIVFLIFVLYSYFRTSQRTGFKSTICYLPLLLPVVSLVTIAILNGPSFFSVKDATDGIMKTVILSVISAIMSWMLPHGRKNQSPVRMKTFRRLTV